MKHVLITVAQKEEIGALAAEHADALIAYGADLYRKGMINGAIAALTGVAIFGISKVIKEVKKSNTKETKTES